MTDESRKQRIAEPAPSKAVVESLDDPLLLSAAEPGSFQLGGPMRPATRGTGRGSNAAMWFFGAMVTALLAVQTLQLLTNRVPDNQQPPPATRHPASDDDAGDRSEIDRMLQESRTRNDRGAFETTIRLLEPLVENPARLTKSERTETYYLLSQAHRALGNIPRAQAYYLRAIDQSVDRHEPSLILEDASDLRGDGRFSEARQRLCGLLARRDGLAARDLPCATLAAARLADLWYAQATASGDLAPLPGIGTEASR